MTSHQNKKTWNALKFTIDKNGDGEFESSYPDMAKNELPTLKVHGKGANPGKKERYAIWEIVNEHSADATVRLEFASTSMVFANGESHSEQTVKSGQSGLFVAKSQQTVTGDAYSTYEIKADGNVIDPQVQITKPNGFLIQVLSSPEFAVGVGVGVGLTLLALRFL